MARDLEDRFQNSMVDFSFHTSNSSGPQTLSGTPALAIRKANSVTQYTDGITLSVDHDSITGLNHVRLDLSANAAYTPGADYEVIVTAGTVGGTSVVGAVVATFSIRNRGTMAGVLSTGKAVAASTTTLTLQPGHGVADGAVGGSWVEIIDGPGKGESQQVASKTGDVLTFPENWPVTPTTASVYDWYGGPPATAAQANGSGLTAIPQVGAVTGNVGGNVVGSVGNVLSLADGIITLAKFAAGAIDSTVLATDVIGASQLSAAAVAKIEAALLNEGDGQALIDAIVQAIDAADIDTDILPGLVRDAILNRVLAGNHDTAGTVGQVLQDAAKEATVAAVSAAVAAVQATANTIEADTDELQQTLADGGFTDNLLDLIIAQTVAITETGVEPTGPPAPTADLATHIRWLSHRSRQQTDYNKTTRELRIWNEAKDAVIAKGIGDVTGDVTTTPKLLQGP